MGQEKGEREEEKEEEEKEDLRAGEEHLRWMLGPCVALNRQWRTSLSTDKFDVGEKGSENLHVPPARDQLD